MRAGRLLPVSDRGIIPKDPVGKRKFSHMPQDSLLLEKFGPLQGVKIVSTGTLIAQPFAAELAAEMGAEVIQIERPVVGDVGWRTIGVRLKNTGDGPPVPTTSLQQPPHVF